MNIKPFNLDIVSEEPFSSDKLGRNRSFGERFTNLVSNIKSGYVISLNGGYGTGKSTFLNMWVQDYTSKKQNAIYLNIWESDFAKQPLIPIILAIENYVSDERNDFQEGIKKTTENITRIGKELIKIGTSKVASATSKIILAKSFGAIDLEEIISNLQASENKKNQPFETYLSEKKLISDLRKSLASLAEKINGPLVIIIDELDRCRPDYAIETLEIVKHIFSIPGIIVVLGINKKQLGYSICTKYGQEMDSNGYLQRFIDLEITLPEPQSLKAFIGLLLDKNGLGCSLINLEEDELILILEFLFKKFNYTLRDIEKYVHKFSVITLMSGKSPYPEIFFMAMMFIKDKDEVLYSRIQNYQAKLEDVLVFFQLSTRMPSNATEEELYLHILSPLIASYRKKSISCHNFLTDPVNKHEVSKHTFDDLIDTYQLQQKKLTYIEEVVEKIAIPQYLAIEN